MKIIFRASDILEAHIVAGMLQSYGIAAYVGGHYLQGAVGDVAPLGIANILVQDEDSEQAEQIINSYQAGAETDASEQGRESIEPLPAPG
ncbi:putative signal transducing protein [Arsukibacterium sp.]|uniref:putative signal transducing protein n=1 Tax=Arsukibacterium sp. TaxID=1977258 RepID=UPI002FD9E846